MENKESFQYTYSASAQQEVANIRKKYLPKEENKLDQLRRLHRSASQKARTWALVIGILGALILGTGMSLVTTPIGQALGMTKELSMLCGIAVGLVGMGLVALAYPLYNRVLHTQRKRIAPEILRLSDELLK